MSSAGGVRVSPPTRSPPPSSTPLHHHIQRRHIRRLSRNGYLHAAQFLARSPFAYPVHHTGVSPCQDYPRPSGRESVLPHFRPPLRLSLCCFLAPPDPRSKHKSGRKRKSLIREISATPSRPILPLPPQLPKNPAPSPISAPKPSSPNSSVKLRPPPCNSVLISAPRNSALTPRNSASETPHPPPSQSPSP